MALLRSQLGEMADLFQGRTGKLTAGLILLEVANGMQIFAVSTALPVIADALHGRALYGVALTVSGLAIFITTPLAGPANARLGLPRVLSIGMTLYVIGALASAVAPTMTLFLWARVVAGLGVGLLTSLAFTAIASAIPAERRSRVISLSSGAWIVPGLVGPPLAAFITSAFGWRITIVWLIPVIVVARAMVVRNLGTMPPPRDRRTPLVPTVAFVAALGVMLAAQNLPMPYAVIVFFAALIAVFAVSEKLFPEGTRFARRGHPAAIAALFLLMFAFFGSDALATFLVVEGMRQSLYLGGLALTLATIGWSLAGISQPMIAARFGSESGCGMTGALLVVIGIALVAGGIALTGSAAALGAVLAGWTLAGIGMGLGYAPLATAAVDVDAADAVFAANAVMVVELLANTVSRSLGGLFIGGRVFTAPLRIELCATYCVFALVGAASPFVARRIHGRAGVARPAR